VTGTRRQQLVALLSAQPCTVKQLSALLGVRVADVVSDLEHIRRSLGKRLEVTPSSCTACGFTMDRGARFTAPSRCPRCRSERTSEPLLSVRGS
jgi:predicted Zn-ribbon and HTH transcriptional regulator